MGRKICVNVLILLIAGCASNSSNDRSYISDGIKERTNYELGPVTEPGRLQLPPGVSIEDGLTQDEAVAIALWNNAQFQVDLAALGFARADLIEAKMLANPTFSILFPVGPKLLEASLDLPIDVLWQRPHRIAAANLDAKRLSEDLIKDGLGLIRDVQTTFVDLWQAQQRLGLAQEDTQLSAEIANLAKNRLQAGDISELEASAAYTDLLQAKDDEQHFSTEAICIRHRLDTLLGLVSYKTATEKAGGQEPSYNIVPPEASSKTVVSLEELFKIAFAVRPDLRAAELKIESAGERIGWEKSKVYNFIAIIDGKDEGSGNLTVGPGFTIDVPAFNQNNSGIARAKAELEQAVRQYESLRQEIILQVRQGYTQYVSAQKEYEAWNNDIVPSLEKASEQAQKSFAFGEMSYQFVLEAKQKLLQAKIRRAESAGNLHRSTAQLDYCIGRRMIDKESNNFVKQHD
jgi:cobalt-zinc-cadmium efflux system outer membrane protein